MNKDLLGKLNTRIEGLTDKEVEERLKLYGQNILPRQKKNSFLKLFFNELKNPIDLILLVTVVLSFIVGEKIDAIFIILIILLDAILGSIQEYKAAHDLENILNLVKINSNVRRNNKEEIVDSKNLVVGDIVLVNTGTKLSADMQIIECCNLRVDESVLTGESLPVDKSISSSSSEYKTNILYAGTSVMSGRAVCVVIKTGVNTEIGKIATSIISEDETKPLLLSKIEKFTKQISIYVLFLMLFLLIVLYFKNYNLNEIFLSVIGLTISAIPEGLPLAITLALTISSRRMSKKNVIVKKINSVETLGSVTLIASDKTGTLTLNEQTAKKIMLPNGQIHEITGIGYNDDGIIENQNEEIDILSIIGGINNESKLYYDKTWISQGDSIDIAFKSLLYKSKKDIKNYNVLFLEPYESEKKYSACLYEYQGYVYKTIKGSLETVLKKCKYMSVNGKQKPIEKELIIEQNDFLASSGYRVIALALKHEKDFIRKNSYDNLELEDMTFIGLVGFIDPIRKEVINSINECNKANIKIAMITGDHPLTAYKIAKELNIINNFEEVITGEELKDDMYEKYILSKKVFARVTPNQKLKIVEAFMNNKEVVAVTGDGVNDAPALKKANVGIAMGSGTDVAKETSSIIITDDSFSSVVKGILEGRIAYSNIRKVIYFLLSCGISEIILFLLSIIFDLPLPLVAIQLLWLNLVTDGIQDISLSFEKESNDIMKEKPKSINEKIFNELLIKEILISGIIIGVISFVVWKVILSKNLNLELSRGYLMLFLVFIQNLHTFNCRSEKTSLFKLSIKNNYLIYIGIIATILLQIVVSKISFLSRLLKLESVSFEMIVIFFIISLPIILVMEIFKKIRNCKIK